MRETSLKGSRDREENCLKVLKDRDGACLKRNRNSESTLMSDLNVGDSRLSSEGEELENELSCTARSHLDKHIQNIDHDLHQLAKVFREKHLKEKAMRGFVIKASSCTWKKNEIANVIIFKMIR